jgi:hypothetical protein
VLARGTCLAVALCACNLQHGIPFDDRVLEDGSIEDPDGPPADARADAPPGATCFGVGLFRDCYQMPDLPTNVETLTNALIDTSNSNNCTRLVTQNNGPQACLRTARDLTISGNVRFVGTRPIILLATGAITIASGATLDVSSARDRVGAGGNTGTCAAPAAGVANTSSSSNAGSGGGGGGGFGTAGGAGGTSDAAGGAAGGTTALTQIRGGCRGAQGGASRDAGGGAGGNGGGSVYLVAGSAIAIAGAIEANGSGGWGGPSKAGAGGGGSGGLIGLDAPSVSIAGVVYANGGGGGEGGPRGLTGEHGSDPSSYNQRAGGGNTYTSGGDGGGGSAFANTGVNGSGASNGAGGGGGGAGRIKVFQSPVPSGQMSPPAT